MATLKEKAQQILDEKVLKILPENIRKDIKVYDVIGAMEPESNLYEIKSNSGITETPDTIIGALLPIDIPNSAGINDFVKVGDYLYIDGVYCFENSRTVYGRSITKIKTLEPNKDITATNYDYTATVEILTFTERGIDTSDATAISDDILENKTAYVNGVKVEGTMPTLSSIRNIELDGSVSSNTDVYERDNKLNIVTSMTYGEYENDLGTFPNKEQGFVNKNTFINVSVESQDVAGAIGLLSNEIMTGNTVLGISGTATEDADALASDIVSGKTAYVNGQKITGTVSEFLETYPSGTQAGMRTNDVEVTENNVVKFKAPKDSLIRQGGYAWATGSMVADEIGLDANKIVSGNTILGIEGTTNISNEMGPVCYTFYSDEDAKAFTGYRPGDKAIVYKLDSEPFNYNIGIDNGLNTGMDTGFFRDTLICAPKVTLDKPMEVHCSLEWTRNTGNNSKQDCKFALDLDATKCWVTTVNIQTTATTDSVVIKYSSTDGINYTFDGVWQELNNSIAEGNEFIINFSVLALREELGSRLKDNWSQMWILSKFLHFKDRKTLQKIYTYEPNFIPVTTTGSYLPITASDNVYPACMKRSYITSTTQHLVPYVNPVPFSNNIKAHEMLNEKFVRVFHTPSGYYGVLGNVYVSKDLDGNTYVVCWSDTEDYNHQFYKFDFENNTYTTASFELVGVYTMSPATEYYQSVGGDYFNAFFKVPGLDYLVQSGDVTSEGATTKEYYAYDGNLSLVDMSGSTPVCLNAICHRVCSSISLKEDTLGLIVEPNSIPVGNFIFANEYIEGNLVLSSISADEEQVINEKLDEILGGAN